MIIPGLNIFKYIQAHLLSCFKLGSINQLGFERFKETFSHRVIPAVAFPAHTLIYPIVLQQINGLFAGILNSPVRVKDHPFFKRSATIGHSDSRYDSAGSSQIIADRPTKRGLPLRPLALKYASLISRLSFIDFLLRLPTGSLSRR
jgi:hypothetical protein